MDIDTALAVLSEVHQNATWPVFSPVRADFTDSVGVKRLRSTANKYIPWQKA